MFNDNNDYQYSIAFVLLQIVELAARLDFEILNKAQIKALKNRIVHGYGSIDKDMLWEISHIDIKELRNELERRLEFDILRRFAIDEHIDFLAVYGSFHYGNQSDRSDIDIIVDSYNDITYDTMDKWSVQLSLELNRKADLITVRNLISSPLCGYVWRLKEYTTVYGAQVVLNPETLP